MTSPNVSRTHFLYQTAFAVEILSSFPHLRTTNDDRLHTCFGIASLRNTIHDHDGESSPPQSTNICILDSATLAFELSPNQTERRGNEALPAERGVGKRGKAAHGERCQVSREREQIVSRTCGCLGGMTQLDCRGGRETETTAVDF